MSTRIRSLAQLLPIAAACAALCSTTYAQDAEPEPEAAPESDTTREVEEADDSETVIDGAKELLDGDSVFKQVEPDEDPEGLFEPAVEDSAELLWDEINGSLDNTLGLRFGFAYTVLGQWAPDSDNGTQGITGDLDFTGTWHLVGRERDGNAGYLGFATEWRHEFGPRPASDLAAEFDAFSRTTQSFNDQNFDLVQLWWSQELLDSALEITAGKVSPRTFYNTNRLRNPNDSFLNQAFAGNLAVGLPGRGIGGNVTFRPDDRWYISGGVHDANGAGAGSDFDTLDEGQFAYIGEFGWTPQFEELGRGNYRLTVWHTNRSEERGTDDGTGFALSLDQDLGEHAIGFVRYAYADGDATAASDTLSGGVAFRDMFGREDDVLGIGLGWSDPDRPTENDEFVGEVYYRLQLTDTQQFTVGWQGYATPAFDPDDDFRNVISVRWRIRF